MDRRPGPLPRGTLYVDSDTGRAYRRGRRRWWRIPRWALRWLI